MMTRIASVIAYLKNRLSRWSARYLRAPISLTSDDPGKLKNIASANSALVRWSAKIIVGGLIVEVLVLLWFSAEKSWLETGLLIVANLIIAAGVFGEDHFAHRAGEVALRLQQISDEKVAEANARAAEANQKAQETILELARLQANVADQLLAVVRAGRDNAIASEVTRSVTEALAVRLGSVTRETTSEATRALYIVSKIEPFAGKQFDAVVTSTAIDLGGLARSLRAALKNAGWIEIEQSDPTAGVGLLSMDRAGGPALVRIDVDASKESELLDAAETLASALKAEGIAAVVNPTAEANATNASMIHIFVGPKP